MNDIQVFSNVEFGSVRCIEKDGEPWWVLKDVCDVLELTSPNKVSERLDDDELTRMKLLSGGQMREMNLINESGLYNVIIRSDKPNAKAFRKWITSEVIPSIRKTGSYGIPQMSQSELILKIAQNNLELETVSGCDLHRRQINLKKRMELAGATYAERQAVTLIDIIAKDEKLKAIFDGIVRKYKIRYANGEYRPGVRMR